MHGDLLPEANPLLRCELYLLLDERLDPAVCPLPIPFEQQRRQLHGLMHPDAAVRVGADGLVEQPPGGRVVHVDVVVVREEELHCTKQVVGPRQLPQPLDAVGGPVDLVLVRLEPGRVGIDPRLILPGTNPSRHVPVGVEDHILEGLREERREPLLDPLAILVDPVHPLSDHHPPAVDLLSLVLQRRLESGDIDEDVLLAEVGRRAAQPPLVERHAKLCKPSYRRLIQGGPRELIQLACCRKLPEPLVGLQCSAKRCVEGRVARLASLKPFGGESRAECHYLTPLRLLRQHLRPRQRLPCITRRIVEVSSNRLLQRGVVERGRTQALEEGSHVCRL